MCVIVQLPHKLFGLKFFSLKKDYLWCIVEQLRYAFNDPSRLETVNKWLIQHILVKERDTAKVQIKTSNYIPPT